MTDISARTVAVDAKAAIGDLGGAWMSSDAEEQATIAAGMQGWQLYFLGRHGVLGDVDPDVVVAAAGVFPARHLRSEWNAARRLMSPSEAVRRYLAVCHAWGREHLTAFSEAERLAALGLQVVEAADVTGLPLFAGWRAVELPDEPSTRCAQVMHVLREHRGACHVVALAAYRMPSLTAILTNTGGEENAIEYGWQPPFPIVTEKDRARRREVEELTDDIAAPAYEGLSPAEREEFLELLERAHQEAFER